MDTTRAPFQVLVLPYRFPGPEYAVFRRVDPDCWQGIAGGGEGDERPLEAAKREALEEARIPGDRPFVSLDSVCSIPVEDVCGFLWGEDTLVIPEYAFGVLVGAEELVLSSEHSEYRWACYEEARRLLRWDSNRTALWELNHRLTR